MSRYSPISPSSVTELRVWSSPTSLRTGAEKKRKPGSDTGWTEEQRTVREAAVTSITLDKSFGDPLVLKTGSLKSPMKALGACADDLLTRWGLDPAAHKTLSKKVAPKEEDQFTSAIRETGKGTDSSGTRMRVLMIVSAKGSRHPAWCSSIAEKPMLESPPVKG